MDTILSLATSFFSGGLIGGLLRLAPEVLKYLNGKADRAHEIEMRKLDIQAAKARTDNDIRLADAQAEGQYNVEMAKALAEANKAQMQRSGIKWIDALNSSVRPVSFYWYFLLYNACKVATIIICWRLEGYDSALVSLIWTPFDSQTLGMIFSFWYLDRKYARER